MSSYFDEASLVMIPSGYKDQKIYSVKPLSGAGDLAFTRASTATRVNASGLIESVATGLPRLNYDPANPTCPSLLLEPQRTNLALYSEQFNNAGWNKETGNSITANSITSPDGYVNADTVTATNGNVLNVNQSLPVPASTASYTLSVFLKKKTTSTIEIYLYQVSIGFVGRASINFDAGTITASVGTPKIENYGNGWYRASVTATLTSSLISTCGLFNESTTGERNAYAYGFQVEQAAYATSYIGPTLAASVTRVADAASKTGISSLIGQTEGTIFWEGSITGIPVDQTIFGVEKESSNFVIRFGGDGTNIYAQSYNGSTSLFFQTTTPSVGQRIKLAFAYKAGSYAFYKNGTLVASGTNASTMPACDKLQTNVLWSGASGIGAYNTNQALLFKTRLTNAQLAEITTL